MTAFIFVTAVIVSIDAMAAGFALAMKGSLSPKNILLIGLITLMLCVPAAIGGKYLESWLGEDVNLFGGVLLILIGVRNLATVFSPPPRKSLTLETKDTDAAAVGLAVGLDAAVANLSISVMGVHSLLVPCLFAAMHIVAVGVGYIVLSFFWRSKALEAASAILLAAIGVYKLVSTLLGG